MSIDTLLCPCCQQPTDRAYLRSLQAGLVRPWRLRDDPDWLATWARAGRARWACAACIDAGRAIRADPSRHVGDFDPICPVYHDIETTCRACGVVFVHSAEEQRVWYEEYRLMMRDSPSIPHRCLPCRYGRKNARRAMHALQAKLAEHDPRSADDLREIARLYRAVGADRKAALFLRRAKNRAEEWQRDEILAELAEVEEA